VKRIYSGVEYQNLDVYQVNCTYYSALENNDDSYIAARAIQFFTPGIPQVYYVGLLAGKNDVELVEKTQNGRDINRHNFTLDEIAIDIKKPVAQRLLKLMKFRNNYPAFNGEFKIHDSPESEIILSWTNKKYQAIVFVDLYSYQANIKYYDDISNTIKEFSA
jgi:sucrose phosphorylase